MALPCSRMLLDDEDDDVVVLQPYMPPVKVARTESTQLCARSHNKSPQCCPFLTNETCHLGLSKSQNVGSNNYCTAKNTHNETYTSNSNGADDAVEMSDSALHAQNRNAYMHDEDTDEHARVGQGGTPATVAAPRYSRRFDDAATAEFETLQTTTMTTPTTRAMRTRATSCAPDSEVGVSAERVHVSSQTSYSPSAFLSTPRSMPAHPHAAQTPATFVRKGGNGLAKMALMTFQAAPVAHTPIAQTATPVATHTLAAYGDDERNTTLNNSINEHNGTEDRYMHIDHDASDNEESADHHRRGCNNNNSINMLCTSEEELCEEMLCHTQPTRVEQTFSSNSLPMSSAHCAPCSAAREDDDDDEEQASRTHCRSPHAQEGSWMGDTESGIARPRELLSEMTQQDGVAIEFMTQPSQGWHQQQMCGSSSRVTAAVPESSRRTVLRVTSAMLSGAGATAATSTTSSSSPMSRSSASDGGAACVGHSSSPTIHSGARGEHSPHTIPTKQMNLASFFSRMSCQQKNIAS